ncbi:MerR-like helix-turn-helix DNA binding domain protein [Gordonia phage Dre3]|uniref:MerR-like helix-turn-helix DNA binding protein n=1 Tax=Gordonia phage Gibbous TaxID=2652405 RepID=A0A5J6T5U5_9CAUD|nr:MerR-like helix-turn-helix DNA binding protein [Gordonia phage Gibbous]QFG05107.1 MerR-like helix-turn-helix DNA binding protein [Gordonia phage Gibbous]QRI45960.1 MerR-like helix-turn-helix DNA binding domain protein [Gordonia phage Dre3]
MNHPEPLKGTTIVNSKRAAEMIGIAPKPFRDFVRKNANLLDEINRDRGSGAVYDFSLDEVDRLKTAYWSRRKRTKKAPEDTYQDSPGLPLSAIGDPSMKDQFQALRVARAARLDAAMKKARMTLPQMSEARLMANGRVLSLEGAE